MTLSLAENVIVAGVDNRPPMLEKTNYNSWAIRMLLYIKGKENGNLLVDSVLNGPFQLGTIEVPRNENTPATIRERTHADLTEEEKLRASVDIKVYLKTYTTWLIIMIKQSRSGIESNSSFKVQSYPSRNVSLNYMMTLTCSPRNLERQFIRIK
ncbi:hypothetical protein Tco_0891671 [Tanacetum coccineum]|uniref:DUF4219 domain-containing protein n=1 Tax=Tanacetum coccineum TaxID=301880 RepID=A0ABQ5C919_9ASTR